MTTEKVVFFHHLPREILDVITAYTPEGFTTVVVDADQPEDEKISAAEDADFITGVTLYVDGGHMIAAHEQIMKQFRPG